MRKKFGLTLLALVATGVAFAPGANAGTDMIIDNSAQAPPPQYNYAPPPRVVYYVPPPPVVVYRPAVPVRVYAHHRPHVRRGHCAPFWR